MAGENRGGDAAAAAAATFAAQQNIRMETNILGFFHSLLRYGVLAFVAAAGLAALNGLLRGRPILVYERTLAMVAVLLCHVQLVLGLILYFMRFKAFGMMQPAHQRFWKMEHIGTMVIAIVLVTVGRAMSKRAKEEPRKQRLIAIFFLIALVLMLWATPWPFKEVGRDLGWL